MGQLMLHQKTVSYEEQQVHISKLAFYPENPRIYSQFGGEQERTQESIQEMLESMEHVRALRIQIDQDGQVNEPLYCVPVQSGSPLYHLYDYQVLEGNSRLAALKMNKSGTLPTVMTVPCWILDFSRYSEKDRETLIFSLLGRFHIIGKTDWTTYENAAYIHRRHKNQGVPIDEIGHEIGKQRRTVQNLIAAFENMLKARDTKQQNWSYYEVLESNTHIRQARENDPTLNERLIDLIKRGKMPTAMKMRDHLPDILKSRKAKRILLDQDEEDPFDEALAVAETTGDTSKTMKQLEKFRKYLADDSNKRQIRRLLQDEGKKGPAEYHLKQITRSIDRLVKRTSA